MIIKSLKINNLQLIKSAQVDFDKINIISGINKDNPSESGNGSGKSTLVLRAILFVLYGYCEEGLTLKDLIRFEEKEASVEIECLVGEDYYRIIRKIPTELKLYKNDVEIQANTNTIKQKMIDEVFGDANFFRQYRCVDLKNGINVLDLGIVSLRKTLMGFIEGIFGEIRTKLLAKKVDKERYSVDKKLYKHYLSEKRKQTLEIGLEQLTNCKKQLQLDISDSRKVISKVEGEISATRRIISYKESETKKAEEGICPILKTSCDRIGKKMTATDKKKLFQEIEQLSHKIEQLEESIVGDQDYLADLEMQMQAIEYKIDKARKKLLRLESAFQFKDYKYTKADIVVYDEAIKVLDSFAGEYIKNWLSSLSLVINNLLKPVNLSVEFTADKEFMYVKDNQQVLKFDMLSTGQKCFLSVIFKLAILMQNNKTGLIIMDDGLNNIDEINFKNLVEIIKTLPFQTICIYQAYNSEIKDIKHFKVIREKGESQIHASY